MLKILMVVRWPVGGIRTFIKYVYWNWGDEKLELHFLVPNLPEVDVLKEQLADADVETAWHITSTGSPSVMEFTKKALQVVLSNKFDIVHAHGFTSAIALSPLVPFISARSVFTSHDVLNESQFEGFKGRLKKVLIPLALNRYKKIHSVSKDAEDNLLNTLPGISKAKSLVISNGVDTERFYSAKPVDLKSKLSLPEDSIIVGFFGRFMSQKGFKYLIDAMASFKKDGLSKYKVICFGAGAFIREEKNRIDNLGLSDSFYFHDFVADTAPYVKGCDLVVMPSLWEACGLVAMEVLAAGRPLVASSCIGLREVCEGSPAIMIEPANAKSLKSGILAASEVDESLFENFAPIATTSFSVKVTQEQIKLLYHSLVK